jgi:hypothetical protein
MRRSDRPVKEIHPGKSGPLRFPVELAAIKGSRSGRGSAPAGDEALAIIEGMSRRMEDLARSLDCLGYFDDPDDKPRAA